MLEEKKIVKKYPRFCKAVNSHCKDVEPTTKKHLHNMETRQPDYYKV